MCYNCGCMLPDDDMGHPDNITNSTLQKLADSWKLSLDQTKHLIHHHLEGHSELTPAQLKDLDHVFTKASKAWGQPIKEAKNNTEILLSTQVGH